MTMTDDERRWLEECFRGVREDVAGVNARLDRLNGSVRAQGEKLIEHSQAIGAGKWFAGAVIVALLGIVSKLLIGS